MLWILLGFVGFSLIIFIIGVIWILVTHGKTYRRSGPEVGKEIMTDIMTEDTDEDEGVVLYSTFKGKAAAVEREASIGWDDIKAALKARDWPILLALLMIVGGFLGLCLCGGLSLLLAL
ncbi:MAG: hypothetical protein JXM69_20825 [Anaerolineae bacterium]|nr:hypothetical protein [Anaerolineae bacterium]